MEYYENVINVPFFTSEECDEIKDYALQIEQGLIDDGFADHKEHGSYDNVLTSNYFRYNFFAHHPHYAERLAQCLHYVMPDQNLEWPIAVQAWCNVYRNGEGIDWHNHSGTMGKSYTANIFIDGPTAPGITYKAFNKKSGVIENQKGHMHIIPCELFHKVSKNKTDEPRFTIGLTVHSYQTISKTLIDRYAFNSKTYQDTIILTREHIMYDETEQS